jgi:hypothetical protein
MAGISSVITLASTSNLTSYATGSFTPVNGDLIVVLFWVTTSIEANPTCTASANGITFTLVDRLVVNGGTDIICSFIADQKVGASPSAMTISVGVPSDAGAGCGIQVFAATGMDKVGSTAVLQHSVEERLATNIPTLTFGSATNSNNPIVAAASSNDNPAALTPPTGFTESLDTGISAPVRGWQSCYIISGTNSTTIQYGAAGTTRGGTIGIELDSSASSGTTPVSDTWQTSWNIKSQISDAWQTLWNTNAPIQDSWQTNWNTQAQISDSWQTSWNVLDLGGLTAVGDTWQTSWNTRTFTSDIWQTSWNIKLQISDNWQTSWIVKAFIQDSWQTLWNIKTQILDVWQTSWNVLTSISDAWQTKWNTLNQILDSWQTLWNLGGPASNVWSTFWNIFEKFTWHKQEDLTTAYNKDVESPVDYDVLNPSATPYIPVSSITETYDKVDKPTTIWSNQ